MESQPSNPPSQPPLESQLIPESEELQSKEYLGTFRWKRSLKFPILPPITTPISYLTMNKWSTYISSRLSTKEFEPYVIDALSYPLSIIYSLNTLIGTSLISLNSIQLQETINIIILGASSKTECRIALESNYFDEIYYFLVQVTSNTNLKVHLYFVGEEVPNNNSYNSTQNKNLVYYFSSLNTGDFLKANLLEFNKKNSFIFGLNCGFGAGYMKLTYSWIYDLIKLIKINYFCIFTYTNDYEDKVGEIGIIKDLLGGKVVLENNDNPFKSMTTYKSEDSVKEGDNVDLKGGNWSCGNYGFYVINGGDKKKFNLIAKMEKKEVENEIRKTIKIKE